jgi:multidrug efflux system membrane fusion protein
VSRFLWLGILVTFIAVLEACSRGTPPPSEATARAEAAVPVKVGTVEQRSEPVQIGAIGNIQPYSTVSVKSEVGGELTAVHFTEGQEVRKGQLLFTIDPRPFEAALKQAQANRTKDVAQAANAQADADRYKSLVAEGVIARQQYDQARANADALKAAVAADEAAIETARLQLSYTKIYAPVDGRTGNLLVHEGNLVKENDVPLVVINQIEPIYAAFSVPAEHLPDITRYKAQHPLRVEAGPKGSNQRGAEGVLTFIDNNVDTATGTIQLKATFQNRDHSLWPGEFVDVTVTLTNQPNAIVVPAQAIQTSQEGQFVFVVKPDMTVESRPVVVDRTRDGFSVVSQGLRPGETVVTDGQLRLSPGARISVGAGEPGQ